jgi:hypothetical protein
MIRRFSQLASDSGLYESTQRHQTKPSQIRPIGFWLRRYPDLDVRWPEFPFALMNCQNAAIPSHHVRTVETYSAGEGLVRREAVRRANVGRHNER